jgi:hypothetical protein
VIPLLLSASIAAGMTLGGVGLCGALRAGPPTVVDFIFDGPAIIVVLIALSVADVVIYWRAQPRRAAGVWLAATVFSLALAVSAAEIRHAYPRGTAHDFPHAFATFHQQNFNLTESLFAAQNILGGRGNALPVAGGATKIDTYRMPGYAMFAALAGTIFRISPDNLAALGAATVYLQVWFFCLALAYVTWRLSRVLPIPVVVVLGVMTCWLPQDLDMTENDSTILACGLLIAGALAPFFPRQTDPAGVPLRHHLALHGAFGLYVLMRSDVLAGWAFVSLFLYRRRPLYLLLPLCAFLAIGGAWGLYKRAHGSAFVMTTSNIGHVGFVGLWQTPRHKFVWKPSDESYVSWIERYGYVYMEPRTNAFAAGEVLRFWFTYPGFVIGNAWYKAYSYFRYETWIGSLALAPARVTGLAMRVAGAWLLFLVFVLARVVGFEPRVTFLLGWPVLLDLPLFWILQHNARYVPFVTWSLMAAAATALLSPDFYHRLAAKKSAVMAVLTAGIAIWAAAPIITTLLMSDAVRYWTPWLDPSRSTLNVLTH